MMVVHLPLSILAIAIAVLFTTALASRLRFSAPLLLMLVGIAASFVPFLEIPRLSAEVVLLGFLPPLLYAAAIRTSVIDFRVNRYPIAGLSVVLVVLTTLGIGVLTWLILPVPFAVAFAFGAVVAPPDAVAATSIARRIGLPRRLVAILEGESLVNDATAITCLRLGLAAIATGFSAVDATLGFFTAAVGGAAIGLLVAAIVVPLRRRITRPAFDTALSLIVPFAAYLPTEALHIGELHGSGVIAVVTAGLVLGHKSPVIQSGQSRLSERVNWATIQLLLENAVFLLIGLQARNVLDDVANSPISTLRIAMFCVAALIGVIVIRMIWVLVTRALLFRRSGRDTVLPPWSHSVVIGWAGLRGVVTLAAALLIPVTIEHSEILVLAAMVVTAGTLLLQGLTLPALVRRLHLKGPDPRSDALVAATVLQTASNAALTRLDGLIGPDDSTDTIEMVRRRIAMRPNALWEQLGRNSGDETPSEQYRRLRLTTINSERDEVLRIRSEGTVDHEVIEQVLATLDIEESMLTVAAERADRLRGDDPVATPSDPTGSCPHLDEAPSDLAARSEVCEDCVQEGTRPVHLRVCVACGIVGCCDSSSARHANRHFRTTGHPVMRSFEPGESWRWCYLDERIG